MFINSRDWLTSACMKCFLNADWMVSACLKCLLNADWLDFIPTYRAVTFHISCQLRTPVRLDDAFLEELETLIALLARHISEV